MQAAVQALIPVFTGTIHDEQAQLIDARTLHRFLGIDTEFRKWIARRIEEYGFQEGEDFRSFLAESSGGRRSRDYHITLDMAKELSMVERNDKGRQARRYFIECEKRLQQIAPQDAATIRGQTIGTDGFHCLAAVLDGKVRHLPAPARRGAKNHIWSQVHKAFSVVTAEDIPAAQLDSARNFIAAYHVQEGEWLPKEEKAGTVLDDKQLYNVYFLRAHFKHLNDIFNRYKLYSHFSGIGSPVGAEMIDHFRDGHMAVHELGKLEQEFDAVQRRLGLNKYRGAGLGLRATA